MKRAALILQGEQYSKIMFSVLGKPNEIGLVHIDLEEEYEILILGIPYPKDEKNRIKAERTVNKFLKSNNIDFAYYINQEDEELNSTWHTIKILSIIREASRIYGANLFGESFGIISDCIESKLIEALSQDAFSIMILKKDKDERNIEELYHKIINETGLSLIFVEDIKYLIEQSKVIICEDSSIMEKYKNLLPHPVIDVNRILISPEEIHDLDIYETELKYNEEIGKFIIMLLSNKNIWNMVSWFSYLYVLNRDGESVLNFNEEYSFAGDKNSLTILKC